MTAISAGMCVSRQVHTPQHERLDHIAELVTTFCDRVGTVDPEENLAWLLANTTDQQRLDMLFAACAPMTRLSWIRLMANRYPDDDGIIDEVAVERACQGDYHVALTRAEQLAVAEALLRRGKVSALEIARRSGLSSRSVQRMQTRRSCPQPVDNQVEGVA